MLASFDLSAAVLSGLLAAAVSSLPLHLLGSSGRSAYRNTACAWGRAAGHDGPGGYALGLLILQAIGLAVAVLYALTFAVAGVDDALWLWGTLAAVVQYLMVGPLMLLLPSFQQRPGGPDPWRASYSRLVRPAIHAAFAGHLVFGATVGLAYEVARSNEVKVPF